MTAEQNAELGAQNLALSRRAARRLVPPKIQVRSCGYVRRIFFALESFAFVSVAPKAPQLPRGDTLMRYPPLLISLFRAMLLKPFGEHFGSFALSGGWFLLLVFVTAIYAFRHARRLAVCLTILAVISVGLRFAADHWWLTNLEVISQGASLVAMILVIVAILSEVLRARSASSDLVIGAVCLYLVIGLAWAFLYYSMYLLAPGSIFVSPGPMTLTASESKFTEVVYFSLSAMTTIGSSGEQPLTVLARHLAVVESAMGQLYLAVLISRLVGFSTANDPKGN
jgi:hypothetical protein